MDEQIPPHWEQARRLVVSTACDAEPKFAVLRSAARAEQQKSRWADTVAADRARLLEPTPSLELHEHRSDQSCPVCGLGILDANWAVAARAALEQAENAARDLTAARAESRQAQSAVVNMARAAVPSCCPVPSCSEGVGHAGLSSDTIRLTLSKDVGEKPRQHSSLH